ncbi:glycoside hydrolase family 3 protein [Leucobacter sp. HNU]|uniref:glycoside hydrolase family 3 protein n=1 Tax=Leucobacter sp. HNU TaxID=3236805 RepID=UPI003A805EAE
MSADPTLQRLASGVLWPGFLGTRAPDWLRRGLDDGLPGAVLFGHNVDPEDPDGTSRLAASIRAEGDALLLGIDEEGGSVTRLEAATGSSFPGAAQLGRIGDPGLTRSVAAALGARVRRGGATMVLGPVADVNSNPRNPVIGVRSFGADPETVSRHTAASVEGLRAGGVLSCVKHFPGHGDTVADSHIDAPRVQLGRERMDAIHLPPFVAAIEAGADAVMTAHVIFPEFGEAPATVNPAVLGRLRELGFTGLIVTDALDMAAISQTMGVGPGAVASLAAGADLLCLGNPAPVYRRSAGDDEHDFTGTRDAIVEALRSGALPVERLEEAGSASLARGGRPTGSPGPRTTRGSRRSAVASSSASQTVRSSSRASEPRTSPSRDCCSTSVAARTARSPRATSRSPSSSTRSPGPSTPRTGRRSPSSRASEGIPVRCSCSATRCRRRTRSGDSSPTSERSAPTRSCSTRGRPARPTRR